MNKKLILIVVLVIVLLSIIASVYFVKTKPAQNNTNISHNANTSDITGTSEETDTTGASEENTTTGKANETDNLSDATNTSNKTNTSEPVNASKENEHEISKEEVKEALSMYAILNAYEDLNLKNANYDDLGLYLVESGESRPTKKQFINSSLVQSAIEYMEAKGTYAFEYGASVEDVNKIIKEMTGIEVDGRLDMKNGFYQYNEESGKYLHANGDGRLVAQCLEVEDVSYENGIYTVKYQYCYPADDGLTDININDLPKYEATLKLKLNENYDYAKYCIVSDVYNLK